MNALRKLDAIAQPDPAANAAFTLDARIWGLLIAAYGLLAALATISAVTGGNVQGLDPTRLAYLVIGATLPAGFAFCGGLRLFLGDAGGKRAVVFAIALGYLYVVYAVLRMPVAHCGDGEGVCRLVWFMDLMFAIPILTGVAYLLYQLVRSMQYGKSAGGHGQVVSTILTLIACVALVGSAHGLFS